MAIQKTIDIAVEKPERCPLRKCGTDPEFVGDYNEFCYCEIFDGQKFVNTSCTSETVFPEKCPLDKGNLNLWRSK